MSQDRETKNQVSKSNKPAPKLSDLNKPLQRSGNEIPAGSHPALFVGFGEPFWYDETFNGQTKEKLCLRAYYLLRLPNGEIERQSERLALGSDPLAVNIKSNLYKRLRSFAGNDEKLLRKDGTFGEGVTLLSFTNRPLIVGIKVVEKGGKSYTNIENTAAPLEGLKYPTLEDAERFKVVATEAEHEDEEIPIS